MEEVRRTKFGISIDNFDHAYYMVIKDIEDTDPIFCNVIITWNHNTEDELYFKEMTYERD
jgi:hypothetical protein